MHIEQLISKLIPPTHRLGSDKVSYLVITRSKTKEVKETAEETISAKNEKKQPKAYQVI